MPTQRKKEKPVVILRAAFIRSAGLEGIFPGVQNPECERVLFSALNLDLSDPWFGAFTFSPKRLEGKMVHLTVPKESVLAIVHIEGQADTTALGFRIEESAS